jgi:hypothetical protein
VETQSLPVILASIAYKTPRRKSMATGTWDDFTDKYGFRDGASVEPRDFEARSTLVEVLNDHAAMKAAGLQALECDRPGLHNPCLVVVVKGQGKSAAELLTAWLAGEIEEAPLPDELELEISDLVAEAYEI